MNMNDDAIDKNEYNYTYSKMINKKKVVHHHEERSHF